MYYKLFLLSICFFISKAKLYGQEIKVEITIQHPFLIDHGRVIKSYNKVGKCIDSIGVSYHTGSKSGISLFETEKAFILIDVNGMWYFLCKENRKFCKGYWGWQDPLPKNYLGTYFYNKLNHNYILEKVAISKETIYLFKDPTDYSHRFIKENKDCKIKDFEIKSEIIIPDKK